MIQNGQPLCRRASPQFNPRDASRNLDLRRCKLRIIVATAWNTHNSPRLNGIGQRDHMKASLFIAGLLLAAGIVYGQASQSAPSTQTTPDPAVLPQDKHEGVTLSVDAYTRVSRAKEKFGKADPLVVGILPVEVFLKNETDLPVKLNMDTIQLEVHTGDSGKHQGIDWLAPIQVASAVAHPKGPSQPKARRFPIGVGVPNDDKRDKMLEILKPLALDSDIIPPAGAIHGFLFFDVAGDIPASGDATLYVPDLTVATSNKPLMFFEVALQNASASPQ